MPSSLLEKQAKDALQKAPEQTAGALEKAVPKFTKVTDYTTFAVEWATIEGALVYHFFVTDEVNALSDPKEYWLQCFPTALEQVTAQVFQVGAPRVQAQYIQEVASWWLRANGFADIGDPELRTRNFFTQLDAVLEKCMTKAS